MSSANYKLKSRKNHTKGKFLLEIDLVDRTLYLSDEYVTYTNLYEGIVIDWGDIDTDRSPGAGLSSVGDVNIVIANQKLQFMLSDTHGDKFSDLFNFYDIDFRPARVYQIFEGLTFGSDAEQIFEGEVRIRGFDVDDIQVQLLQEYSSLDLVIPKDKINAVDFASAPKQNLGKVIPVPFGRFSPVPNPFGDTFYNEDDPFAPMVLTNKNTLRFEISRHLIKTDSLGATNPILRWVDEVSSWMTITVPNKTYSNSSAGAFIEFNEPIAGRIEIFPQMEGALNDAPNWENATDRNASTAVSMTGGDILSLKIGSLPHLGRIKDWTAANLTLKIIVNNVTGAPGVASIMKYFNEGYDGGNGGSSNGITETAANLVTNGGAEYPLATDKTAHGNDGAQADENNTWTWDELGSYEFYVECQPGYTFDVSFMYLIVDNIEIISPWVQRQRFLNTAKFLKQKKGSLLRGMGTAFALMADRVIESPMALHCIGIDGVEYGSWITENGRSVGGISSGDLIESFPHAIEWILRNELAIPTSKINTASFDLAFTLLSGWEIAGVIVDLRTAKEHIENILMQSKSRMFKNDAGEYEISVNQATYPEILTNGSLESLDGADDFTSWTEANSGTSTVTDETTIVHGGNHSAKFTLDGSGNYAAIIQSPNPTLLISTKYTLVFYYRSSVLTTSIAIALQNTTSGNYLQPDGTFAANPTSFTPAASLTWKKFSIDFTTEGAGTAFVLELKRSGAVAGALIYIDDISIKRAPVALYDDYKFDKDSNIFNLSIDKTPLNDVLNNVRVNYRKNPANGEMMAEAWIKCEREFSGSLLNEDLDDSEPAVDVDDGTDFNTTTRKEAFIGDEIMTVTGIATNTLTVERGVHSSKARTHGDNERIDILLVDSSDGDSEREDLAIQSAWRFRTNKEVIVDADMIIDSTTAINLRNHLFDYYRRPRWIIDFSTGLNASDIKISSIIEFDHTVMDSWLKLGGESWLNVKFEVIGIRRIDTMTYRIKAIEL